MNYKQTVEHLIYPIDPCESIYQISKNKNVDEIYLQTPTPSENKFLRMLQSNFKYGKHQCALNKITIFQGRKVFADIKSINELLRKKGKLKNAGLNIDWEKKTRGIIVRVPDLIILELGLIVEVDGDSHNRYENKIKRDPNRELIFKSLGFDTLIIANSELNCPTRIQKLILTLLTDSSIKSERALRKFESNQNKLRKQRCLHTKSSSRTVKRQKLSN